MRNSRRMIIPGIQTNLSRPGIALIASAVMALHLFSGCASNTAPRTYTPPVVRSPTEDAQILIKGLFDRSGLCTNVQFDNTPGLHNINYADAKTHEKDYINLVCIVNVKVRYEPGTPGVTYPAYGLEWDTYNQGKNGPGFLYSSGISQSEAEAGVRALTLLAKEAKLDSDNVDMAKLREFSGKATAWRSVQVRPDMPEAARRHKVLAENAFNEKNFEKAAEELAKALELFPCWPEGQFNCALFNGEIGAYRTAMLHMEFFLELFPDAPNAQLAKDKILVWQDKISTRFSE